MRKIYLVLWSLLVCLTACSLPDEPVAKDEFSDPDWNFHDRLAQAYQRSPQFSQDPQAFHYGLTDPITDPAEIKRLAKKARPLFAKVYRSLRKVLTARRTVTTDKQVDLFLDILNYVRRNYEFRFFTYKDGEKYTISVDTYNEVIKLTAGAVDELPPESLMLILAHELGHLISVPYYLGQGGTVVWEKDPQWDQINEKYRRTGKKFAAHTIDDYLFKDALVQYDQMGVQGLTYIRPENRAAIERKMATLVNIINRQKDLGIYNINRSELANFDLQRIPLGIYLNNSLSYQEVEFSEVAARALPGEIDFTEPEVISRIDEVTADHIARLVLEDQLAQLATAEEKEKYALHAFWFFFVGDRTMANDGDACDTHPTLVERFAIWSTSPEIGQALANL